MHGPTGDGGQTFKCKNVMKQRTNAAVDADRVWGLGWGERKQCGAMEKINYAQCVKMSLDARDHDRDAMICWINNDTNALLALEVFAGPLDHVSSYMTVLVESSMRHSARESRGELIVAAKEPGQEAGSPGDVSCSDGNRAVDMCCT